ncbi:phosphoesterase [Beijerinckiaceae bacterium]|nr:phosphoesterase [Beijerinckiaceae bacterium]
MPSAARQTHRPPAVLQILDRGFVVDSAGALFWHEERLLIVADLHFEKGSAFAARKVFLPPYDTAATLELLARLIAFYKPRAVMALGDSFHDGRAGERLAMRDRAMIRALQAGREWIWIAGNHDRDLPAGLEGEGRDEVSIGPIVFRHEPRAAPSPGEIAGHLHPVARVAGRAGSIRRRCFVANATRCILPAFGAFTGGLNLRDAAFTPLFGAGDCRAHVLSRGEVYDIPHGRCLPD